MTDSLKCIIRVSSNCFHILSLIYILDFLGKVKLLWFVFFAVHKMHPITPKKNSSILIFLYFNNYSGDATHVADADAVENVINNRILQLFALHYTLFYSPENIGKISNF